MIAIVDYGLGNLTSILNMCKRLQIEAVVTADKTTITEADKLILPGVGHFKKGMDNLKSSGLKEMLDKQVLVHKKPILGICLGAQLMTKHSEEGNVAGLGWVDAKTVRFNSQEVAGMKVPHMGWSDIDIQVQCPLWHHLPSAPRFYFVHTYHFLFDKKEEVTATATYNYSFACAFHKDNIYGTQFHPEKSHKFGMTVLKNFNQLN